MKGEKKEPSLDSNSSNDPGDAMHTFCPVKEIFRSANPNLKKQNTTASEKKVCLHGDTMRDDFNVTIVTWIKG